MSDRQGFYSVIQYSPAPDRFEFVNIGVVVFAPTGEVRVRVEPDIRRIEKVFGRQDRQHIRMLRDSIQNRIKADFPSRWDRYSIERFIDLRSGMVQMSRPLPFLVKNPEQDLAALFDEMVKQSPKQSRSSKAASVLRRQLDQAGVLDLVVERPEAVQLPQSVEVKAPFAYQNGAYNYIDPVRLEGETNDAFKEAASRAVKGQWLEKASSSKKKLIVVGDLSAQPQSFAGAIHELMRGHRVSFFDMDNLDLLIADIKQAAEDHGRPKSH